jgi:hypothetical protein
MTVAELRRKLANMPDNAIIAIGSPGPDEVILLPTDQPADIVVIHASHTITNLDWPEAATEAVQ